MNSGRNLPALAVERFKSYTYNHSFEIILEKCSTCGAYFNINIDKSKHTCSNTSIQSIDIIKQMKTNMQPKKGIKKVRNKNIIQKEDD